MALCSGGFDSTCLHMDCTHIRDLSCQAKCNFNQRVASRCGLILPDVAAANKSQPALSTNPADNLPGGPNEQLINAGKQLGPAAQNFWQCLTNFGACPCPLNLGPIHVTIPFPCVLFWIVAIIVGFIIITYIGRRR